MFLATAALLALAGCKVRQPGTWETAIARVTKQKITVRGRWERNPLPATPATIHAGRVIFSQYCMECHGTDGQNTGVVFAERMAPPVPPLNSPAVQGYTDGQLKWVIENGIYPSGMPAWRGVLKDEEVWEVVDYIRHLPARQGGGPQVAGSGPPHD
jgi:mono/diheme cytochrome c family protein